MFYYLNKKFQHKTIGVYHPNLSCRYSAFFYFISLRTYFEDETLAEMQNTNAVHSPSWDIYGATVLQSWRSQSGAV